MALWSKPCALSALLEYLIMGPILTGGVDLCAILGVFAKLRKATISFVVSVHPHGTRLPLDGFSLRFVFEYFSEICHKIHLSLKSSKKNWHITLRIIFLNLIIVQQDPTVLSLLYFCRQLYMFRLLTPTITSSYSCNYNFWHWSTPMNRIRCY